MIIVITGCNLACSFDTIPRTPSCDSLCAVDLCCTAVFGIIGFAGATFEVHVLSAGLGHTSTILANARAPSFCLCAVDLGFAAMFGIVGNTNAIFGVHILDAGLDHTSPILANARIPANRQCAVVFAAAAIFDRIGFTNEGFARFNFMELFGTHACIAVDSIACIAFRDNAGSLRTCAVFPARNCSFATIIVLTTVIHRIIFASIAKDVLSSGAVRNVRIGGVNAGAVFGIE